MSLYTAVAAIACSIGAAPCAAPRAAQLDFRGQISGWHIQSRDDDELRHGTGIRYVPQLDMKQMIGTDRFIGIEISLDGHASSGNLEMLHGSKLELYRIALRYATTQTETRIGLQKINFGPGNLLRPLMWFDRLDPRDPVQLTEGVYALRFRYVALNNTSLTLWALYGNDETKGYEYLPSVDDEPEFGGRLQLPVPAGEVALTYHTRTVDAPALPVRFPVDPPVDLPVGLPIASASDFTEHRFALDGRWNLEVGLWFEAVLQQQDCRFLPFEWTKITSLGADYTFAVGNGLHVLCEHMAAISSDKPLGAQEDSQTSALSLNYPLGYLDTVSAIGFYSWENETYYQYISWQRTWDDLALNLSVFHYPDAAGGDLYRRDVDAAGGDDPYVRDIAATGYGSQITVIFNH